MQGGVLGAGFARGAKPENLFLSIDVSPLLHFILKVGGME